MSAFSERNSTEDEVVYLMLMAAMQMNDNSLIVEAMECEQQICNPKF